MTTALTDPPATLRTMADLLDRLGGIAPGRVLLHPAPGHATEADLLAVNARKEGVCELIDGTLVEKAVSYCESVLAGAILSLLRAFVMPRNLGVVSGGDGMMRLFPGLVLVPDVAFTSWDRFPGRRMTKAPIPDLVPDLAVEVLSKSNTKKEMARKRREYFGKGVRLVWQIDPEKRHATVYTSPTEGTTVTDALDGGDVLPGFTLALPDLFAELDLQGPPADA